MPDSRSPFAPLPGTQRPPRAIFVDRWGTLLSPEPSEPPAEFGPHLIVRGAVEALFRAQQAGWTLYLVGNEEAVAFGRQAEADWKRFEQGLLEHLDAQGVTIQRSYACLDHPEGQGRHATNSVFQLPNTGIFYHAAQFDGVRIEDSWVVGDSTLELTAGDRVGCRLAAVQPGGSLGDNELFVEPHVFVEDVVLALDHVLASDVFSRP